MVYKHSNQRERILKLIKSTDTHPTADWIYQMLKPEMPNLSLGTVYRNLTVLVEQGKIQKLAFGSTFDRYDGQIHSHIHLICEKCGRVEDCNQASQPLKETMEGSSSRFSIHSCRTEYFGICENCQV